MVFSAIFQFKFHLIKSTKMFILKKKKFVL